MKKSVYDDRPLSKLVRLMLDVNGFTSEDVAKSLKISKEYFNNKMNRNSFSIQDLSVIGEACGFTLYLDSDLVRFNITELLKEVK